MNDYFVRHSELREEIDKAVYGIFTAVSKNLCDLEKEFRLLINIVNMEKNKKIRSRKMDETINELLEALSQFAEESKDENLIYISEELEKSFQRFLEEKRKLGEMVKDVKKRVEALEKKA